MAKAFEAPWAGYGIGGSPALDFVNTMDWRLRDVPVELLTTFDELVRWGLTAGALTRAEARRLREWGRSHARAAGEALADAIGVREAIAEVFQAVSRGEALPAGPLARVEAACREAWAARSLEPEGKGAVWTWRDDASAPYRTAWTAALDGARLLTSAEREKVGECGDAQCGWLFLDTSRNRSRRWCNMKGCGNRNKARAFYRRSGAAGGREKPGGKRRTCA